MQRCLWMLEVSCWRKDKTSEENYFYVRRTERVEYRGMSQRVKLARKERREESSIRGESGISYMTMSECCAKGQRNGKPEPLEEYLKTRQYLSYSESVTRNIISRERSPIVNHLVRVR